MSRTIEKQNDYLSALLKLIPSEIIAVYVFVLNLIPVPDRKVGMTAVAIALVVLTPIYLIRVMKVKTISQVTVSTISFVIWAYVVGPPFVEWGVHVPWAASAILFVWTTMMPKLVSFGRDDLGSVDYAHFTGK